MFIIKVKMPKQKVVLNLAGAGKKMSPLKIRLSKKFADFNKR